VGPRTGLYDVEKGKFLTLPGLELRPLCLPARSQSLYRLSYPGSWSGGIAPPFFTSTLDRSEWPASRPGRFTPRETLPGTDWIGGWVDPRTGLGAVGKRTESFAPDRNQTPAVQRIAFPAPSWLQSKEVNFLLLF
jgi:hypothetical protein